MAINNKVKYSHIISSRTKFVFHLFPLIVFWVPYNIPIHFLSPEDLQWKYWTEPMGRLTLQYPASDDWKTEIIGKNSTYIYDKILMSHIDKNSTTVKISLSMVPIGDIAGKYGYPMLNSNYFYPDTLVQHFELDRKDKEPNFQVVEKHSDKYLIDGNPASSILSRHSSNLGNTSGMLTIYSIEETNNVVLTFRYIFEANEFMGYLPIAEKILASIKFQN